MPRPDDEAAALFMERFWPEIMSRTWAMLGDHGAEARAEGQQELVAQAWGGYLSAIRRGRAGALTPFTLADYAHRHYRAGRRFVPVRRHDLGPRAIATGAARLVPINVMDDEPDPRVVDPAELVRWRMDLRQVIGLLTERQRAVLIMTAAGWRNQEMAEALCVTPAAVVRLQDRIGAVFRRVGYGW
jgi:DNA-directed RNA polymerase specialized sigma24 family protein